MKQRRSRAITLKRARKKRQIKKYNLKVQKHYFGFGFINIILSDIIWSNGVDSVDLPPYVFNRPL